MKKINRSAIIVEIHYRKTISLRRIKVKKRFVNRALAFVLSIAMVMSAPLSGVSAFAAENNEVVTDIEETLTEEITSFEEVVMTSEESEEVVSEESAVESEVATETETETVTETTTEEITTEETAEIELEADVTFTIDGEGRLVLNPDKTFGTEVVLPDGCKIIPAGIFSKVVDGKTVANTSIKTITGGSLQKIEAGAFKGCTALTSVPTTKVTVFGESAFENCSALTNVSTEKAVTIGKNAFKKCKNYKKMSFPESITSIGEAAFEGTAIEKALLAGLVNCKSFGTDVFKDCVNLTFAYIPGDFKEIPDRTFSGCKKLTSVIMPDVAEDEVTPGKIARIGIDAFKGTGLKGAADSPVRIPKTVKTIDAGAFEECAALYFVLIEYKGDDLSIAETAFPFMKVNWLHLSGDNKVIENYVDYMRGNGYMFAYISTGVTESYKIVAQKTTNGGIILETKTAKSGEKCSVLLSANGGYGIWETGAIEILTDKGTPIDFETSAGPSGSTRVTFIMPEKKYITQQVMVGCTFAAYNCNENNIVALNGSVPAGFGYTYSTTTPGYKKLLNFTQTGVQTEPMKITIQFKDKGVVEVPSWMFNYYSDNPWVTVTSDGRVTANGPVKRGVITAKLKTNPLKMFSFSVLAGANSVTPINDMKFEFSNPTDKAMVYPSDMDDLDNGDYVITIPSSRLVSGNVKIDVEPIPIRKGGTSDERYTLNYTWTSTKPGMVNVVNPIGQGKNTIVISKGASGEYVLKATYNNSADALATDKTLPSVVGKEIIVKIIDSKPRMSVSDFKVNYESNTGAPFKLIPVYGEKIYKGEVPKLYKKTIKNGMETISDFGAANIKYDAASDTYYLIASDQLESKLLPGSSATYTDASRAYLRGYYAGEGGTKAGLFEIPITKIQIVRQKTGVELTTTAKVANGKINLFYTGSDSKSGYVDYTLGTIGEKLDSAFVASVNTYATEPSGDAFHDNYDVEVIDDGKVRIKRSSNNLQTDFNGRNIVSGYLYLKYKGIDTYYVKTKITIPTVTTGPNYMLSVNNAKVSANGENQEFPMQLLDKATKNPIVLNGSISVDNTGSFGVSKTSSVITLKVKGTPVGQKVNILVKLDGWENAVKYPFTLKTTPFGTLATIKVDKTTSTLNKTLDSQSDVLTFSSANQTDAKVRNLTDPVFMGAARLAGEAAKLSFTVSGDKLTVAINDSSIAKGTYKFKVFPTVSYSNGAGYNDYLSTRQVVFNVSIVDAKPSVALSAATAKLNTVCPGGEEIDINYSIRNLPAVNYTVNAPACQLVRATDVTGQALLRDNLVSFDFSTPGCVKVKLSSEANKFASFRNFSVQFLFTGMEAVSSEDGSTVGVGDFKLTVKGVGNAPKVTATGSGKLNTIINGSGITYTMKVANIDSGIKELKVYDVNAAGVVTGESKVFTVDNISGDWSKFVLLPTNSAPMDATLTYKYLFGVVLTKDPNKVEYRTAPLSMKPTVAYPTLKAVEPKNYVYAGTSLSDRYVLVDVDATALNGGKITDFKLSSSNGTYLNNCLELKTSEIVDLGNGHFTFKLRVKTPARFTFGRSYFINIEPVYENQLLNSKAPTFQANLAVRL